MRSAQSRLGAVESLDLAMRGAGRTWELIRVPRNVARWGVAAGGGVVGLILVRRLFGGHRQPVPTPVQAPRGIGGSLVQLLLQVAPIVLAPWLKTQMNNGSLGQALERFHPGRIFFRWLGLEK